MSDWRKYSDEQWMRLGWGMTATSKSRVEPISFPRRVVFITPIVALAAFFMSLTDLDVPRSGGIAKTYEGVTMQRLAIPVVISGLCVSSALAQELLVNGGLEGSPSATCAGFSTLPGGSTAIPGWRVVGPRSVDWNWHNPAAGGTCCDSVPEGNRSIDLNGSPAQDGGAIDQVIATVPGKRYRLSLLALANGCCAAAGTPKTFRITTGAEQSEHTLLTLWGSSDQVVVECDWSKWTRIEREWTAVDASTRVEIRSLVLANAGGVIIDDISVVEVGPRDLLVPSEYATLDAAIAASQAGDRVLIAPGIYPWTPAVVNHPLTIEGMGGALATRFEGNGSAVLPLIECNPGLGATVTIRNIHVDHGRGIRASTGALLVERCLFTRNTQGLLIEGTADFTGAALQSCAFVANGGATVEQAGGVGVYVHAQGAAGASIDSCVFIENRAKEGGGLHTQFSSTMVSHSIFARNSATVYSGGAIARWWGHAAIAVTGCHFDGNSAAWGGTQNWNCCIGCSDCVFSSAFDTTTDCNGNLIPDIAEIRVDPGLDQDSNGVLDACEAPLCLGDVDASSSVDGVDLAIILQNWGTPSPKYPAADVTGDGQVDGADLAIVLSTWGACP